MKNEVNERDPKEIVKELVSRYIPAKPTRISLKLYWDERRSLINLKGDDLDQTAEYFGTMGFTSFAHGVIEAYKEAYGELKVVPVSFREEIYKNDKVSEHVLDQLEGVERELYRLGQHEWMEKAAKRYINFEQ
ncbi:MAG: hypothetical protein QMD36_06690 [Candidatus Aenigmarchaeota archaeon]|nr:hypothetical protein [Candidatus Aenigmarchaeota archaeon]